MEETHRQNLLNITSLNKAHTLRLWSNPKDPDSSLISSWPSEWRVLVTHWLHRGGHRLSYKTVLGQANTGSRYAATLDLLDALLEEGWIKREEFRQGSTWQLKCIYWTNADLLRQALGLARLDAIEAAQIAALSGEPKNQQLSMLFDSLTRLRKNTLVSRRKLLDGLDDWLTNKLVGTRRDFSLRITGDTKGLSNADWAWLESHVVLEDTGIFRHIPLLLIQAPITISRRTVRMELTAAKPCIGLSPAILLDADLIQGDVEQWLIVENRTSFDRLCDQLPARHGLIWLPGVAPSWWMQCVGKILDALPQPAQIAADPDPSGINIAARAGRLWEVRGLNWFPWGMSSEVLANCSQRKKLTPHDHRILQEMSKRNLPSSLVALAQWMNQNQFKAEQESIDLAAHIHTHK